MGYTVVRADGIIRLFADSTPAITFLIESNCYAEMFDEKNCKILQKGTSNHGAC